ncbi:MAG: 50S ribosomal protein L37ae [Nanobdellota archaeon]
MTTKSKKTKSAGRLGVRYGKKVRNMLVQTEIKQKKRQKCPFCNRFGVKRLASGIWKCPKCNKKFAGDSYYLS